MKIHEGFTRVLASRRAYRIGFGLVAAVALGCAADTGLTDDLQHVAASSAELTGGTTTPTSSLQTSGVVLIKIAYPNSTGYCSGALLTNRWVLTAGHCFCQSTVNAPTNVSVSVYGKNATTEQPQLAPLFTSAVEKIIRHGTYDVALVRLDQTLPFSNVPQIWASDGTNLVGANVVAGGFGYNRFDSQGKLVGVTESLNTAPMRIDRIGTTQATVTYPNSCNPAEQTNATDGPWIRPPAGSTASTQEGDSGSPLFLGSDPNTRVIIGVLLGSVVTLQGTKYNAYTGIWKVRDWIRSNTDISARSECPMTLPSSAGATSPAVAQGPNNSVHIVALQGSEIFHWRIKSDGTVAKLGKVPGVTTQNVPALGMESTAASGQPLKLGLASRPSNGMLKYLRWSEDVGWGSPVDSGIYSHGAPAMSNGGVIAFVNANSRVGVTQYNPVALTFAATQLVPASAPNADSLKRVSIITEPAYGVSVVAYRTAANQWQQITGSPTCPVITGSYFCTPDALLSTDWSSAHLVYNAGERLAMVVTRKQSASDATPTLENRVPYNQANHYWGQNKLVFAGEPGAATVGSNTWVAYFDSAGLRVAKADNCFSNSW